LTNTKSNTYSFTFTSSFTLIKLLKLPELLNQNENVSKINSSTTNSNSTNSKIKFSAKFNIGML